MKLENDLVQVDSRALFPPDILGVDQKTGNLVQNAFLANDGKFFADKVDAVINYQLSPRNLLTVSPGFRYAQDVNHDHLNNPNYLANGDTIGVDVALTHALTSRQNLGVLYKLQVLRATNVPGVSNSVYTYFKTYHLFYANQLSRTWWLRSEIGMENVDYQGFAPNTTEIGVGFGLLRTFTNSVFGISYNRGAMGQNINFITGRIGDRADAYYELQLTRRLKWSNGGGFYRETGAPPRTSGDYGSTKVKYSVLTSVTLVGGYTHIFQDSNTLQLLSGTRDTFDFGLTWAPAGIPRR